MRIFVNEKEVIEQDCDLFSVREKFKKNADILIVNGFQAKENIKLNEEDRVTLITRGETPSKEELEMLMVSRHTPLIHNKLKKGKVAIAGAGGLGSNIAISLARVGVGHLKIIDFDVVEPSNLNRQQYYIRHIGMKKVEAIKEILTDINPFIEVEIVDVKVEGNNIQELFSNVDIVVEAFDNPTYKAMIVSEVLSSIENVKVVAASGMAGYYSNNIIKSKKINNRLYICGDFVNEAKMNSGLMAPRVAIVANHQANTVVRLLLNEDGV